MAKNGTPSSKEDTAATVWRLMSKLVLDNQRRKDVAEAVGMSFGRTRAIRRIARRPMSMSQLAAALGIDPPNASALVNELEGQGLVRRSPNPEDRRSTIVEATRSGRKIAERADAILDAPPDSLTALDERDLLILERLLSGLGQPDR